MSSTIAQISKELNISPDELTQRSLLTYLEHELRLAEEDIADIRDKYLVATKAELEKNIKSKKIYSHPAWEDLIAWENTEEHIAKIKRTIQTIQHPNDQTL
jgi:hypothetical protein